MLAGVDSNKWELCPVCAVSRLLSLGYSVLRRLLVFWWFVAQGKLKTTIKPAAYIKNRTNEPRREVRTGLFVKSSPLTWGSGESDLHLSSINRFRFVYINNRTSMHIYFLEMNTHICFTNMYIRFKKTY